MVGIIALIAFMEQAQRRIQILYPRQVMANGVANTNASYLPIKVNMSGVMGPVFASSIMMLPAFLQRFVQSENHIVQSVMGFFTYGTWSYLLVFTLLIAFFAYFQTAVVFNSEETANNLKNAGGYIPGVRPGEQTIHFLDNVVSPHDCDRRGVSDSCMCNSYNSEHSLGDAAGNRRNQCIDRCRRSFWIRSIRFSLTWWQSNTAASSKKAQKKGRFRV